MENLNLSVNILTVIVTLFSGIMTLLTMLAVKSRLNFKQEVVYGDEATLRFNSMKEKLPKESFVIDPPYKYEGGSIIVPRLEYEKFYFDPLLMDDNLKDYKKRIRYFDKEKTVFTWYLK